MEGVLLDDLLQLRHQVGVLAECQPGLGQRVHHLQPQIGQPLGLPAQSGQGGQVRQRLPAPQRQRRPQLHGALGRITSLPAQLDQPLRTLQVGGLGAEVEQVSRPARDDRGTTAEHPAQVRHMALQCVGGGRWRAVVPDDVHEPSQADDLACVEAERGEHGLAPKTCHRAHHAVYQDIDRAEKPYLHIGPSRVRAESARSYPSRVHKRR